MNVNMFFIVHPVTYGVVVLILRLALGTMIAAHGLNKIFGGGKIAGTAGWFASIGVRSSKANAWAAALTEIGSGALLIAGFLTPVACAGVISLMVVAIVTVHFKNGYFIFNANGGGIEYCFLVALVALSIGGLGAGNYSLDHVANFVVMSPWVGLAIAGVGGVGGAVAQLAAFYRPSKNA
jgi:putative oxidoreductase